MTLFWLFLRRYILTFRSNSYLTLFTLFSVAMMLIGVTILLLTQAFMDGAQDVIRSYHLARTPHLLLMRSAAGPDLPPQLIQQLSHQGMTRLDEAWQGTAWAMLKDRSVPLLLLGRTDVKQPTLPISVAMQMGLRVQDSLTLVLPRLALSPIGLQPRRMTLDHLEVGGVPGEEEALYVPMSWVRDHIDATATPDRIIATFDPPEKALAAAASLSSVLPAGWTLQTFRDLNQPLFYALALEKWLMFGGVAFILLIAAMQLATSLRLVVIHHQDTFIILRLHGLTQRVLSLYLTAIGLILGFVGAAGGAAMAWGISYLVTRQGLLELPASIEFLGQVPLTLHPTTVLGIVVTTVILCILAARGSIAYAKSLRAVEVLHAP